MKLGSAKAWARTLGAGLANVQNAVDELAEYGFEKLKQAGSKPKSNTIKNPYLRKATKAGRNLIGFLGQLGASYYDKYEELKRD